MKVHAKLWLAVVLLSVGCNGSSASGQSADRFQFSTDDNSVVLHYEGTNEHIRAKQPVVELTIYGSGRAVSRMPTRKETEWSLGQEELLVLLSQLESAGLFTLTAEEVSAAHAAFVDENYGEAGGPWAQDGGNSRLRVFLDQYRPPGAVISSPIALDLSYENVGFYARAFPTVEELQNLAEGFKLVERVILDRTKRAQP